MERQAQPWLNSAAWTPARAGHRDPLGRGHDFSHTVLIWAK